ncbi:little elongation complex subunit 2 isoform X2 [Agrilus planipennis]|nr:little elongation complex subunit 2 isoform X2 [Agrilus planipennis]
MNLSRHNVSYRIWSFKPKLKDNLPKRDELELRILIRCKLDACEKLENNTLQPVVVAPKLEYQLGYGAEEPTKSELSNLWTSLFFRPYSNLHRVRLNPANGEVILTEACSLQTVNLEAMHFHKNKPSLGLHVVYRICQELVQQEIGAYILHHTPKEGAFVSLLKAVEINKGEPRIGVYDLHTEYKVINCEPVHKHPWRPIDPNFILPIHTAFKRMPGMFIPRDKKDPVKAKRKKKSKSLRNKKR